MKLEKTNRNLSQKITLLLSSAFTAAFIFSVALGLGGPSMSQASASVGSADDDGAAYVDYDTIVEDLQKQNAKQTVAPSKARSVFSRSTADGGRDPFENVWIHAGVGFAQTMQNLTLPNGTDTYMTGRGVQAAVGIDILGPNLSAEGAVRTFGETGDATSGATGISSQPKVTLKEFDLKVLFKARRSSLGLRAGGGLSARYMTARSGLETYDITTPASVLTVGGDVYLTSSISLGLDLATRNAMIAETFDKTSFDGTLRLDTHF